MSGVVRALPHYVMKKEKLPLGDPRHLPKLAEELRKLADGVPGASVSTLDGVRVDAKEGWIHIRPSNTEPVIRLIGEATDGTTLDRLIRMAQAALEHAPHV